jgi:pullulanase
MFIAGMATERRGGGMMGEWPGKAMTTKAASDSTWYEIDLTGYTSSMIIFNGGSQTADLTMPSSGYYWYWPSDGLMHTSVPAQSWIQYARFIDSNTIQVVANKNITSFTVKEGETTLLTGTPGYNAVDIHPNQHGIDLTKAYSVSLKLEGETADFTKDIAIDQLYSSDVFNNTFAYSGNDLGVTYSAAKSSFKVWSPFSSALELRIYQNGTPLSVSSSKGDDTIYKKVAMKKGEKGVWSAEVAEDLNGKYYTYFVTNTQNPNGAEVVDPYAKAVGANGRRGEILDLSTTDPEGWSNVTVNPYDRKELTVWECHIADLTSSTTWTGTATNAKRYAGFHEAGTTYTANGSTVKTGFDHVKELGVNAVQILPMFDQDNDETLDIYDAANNKTNGAFNWGYNPLNYNAPEGIYSSNPYDGAVRIKELKL